jgi:hypothetical protein
VKPLLAAAALLLCATLATGQTPDPNGPRQTPGTGRSEWERSHNLRDSSEPEVALPALPKGGLVEFFVSSASSFKFFIDAQALSVGPDGVVRYTLVARSRSGAENVSYEGMRCENGTYRVYALANDGRWAARETDWRQIEPRSIQRWHNELFARYFCPNGAIIASAEEGLHALRRGGHPLVNNSERAN